MPPQLKRVSTTAEDFKVNVDGEIYGPVAVTPDYKITVDPFSGKKSVQTTGVWCVIHLGTGLYMTKLSSKDEARQIAIFLRNNYSTELAMTSYKDVNNALPLALKQWCRLCRHHNQVLPHNHLKKESVNE